MNVENLNKKQLLAMEKVPPFAEGFSQGALAPHLAKEYEFVG